MLASQSSTVRRYNLQISLSKAGDLLQLALDLSGTIVRVVSLTNEVRGIFRDRWYRSVREDAFEEAFRNEVCLETGVFLPFVVDTNPPENREDRGKVKFRTASERSVTTKEDLQCREQSKRVDARKHTDVINGINVNATLIDMGITTFLLLLAPPLFHVRAIYRL